MIIIENCFIGDFSNKVKGVKTLTSKKPILVSVCAFLDNKC
jgi:hypothetical protein